jgi:2-phosphosulfolactate phosphatase
MKVTRGSLLSGAQNARGIAVVVDVFRAFTCTPIMFSLGIRGSILVASPEEGLAMKKENPALVLVGEMAGVPIDGFDLGNSPSQILRLGRTFFADKMVVQRTSAGVQGALAALDAAAEVLLGSYVNSKATAKEIVSRNPDQVSIVAMGVQLKEKAPEDEWCARYIAHLLGHSEYDHNEALREIVFHETTQKFLRGDKAHFPAEDPVLCLQRDIYDFSLRVAREDALVIVRKARC